MIRNKIIYILLVLLLIMSTNVLFAQEKLVKEVQVVKPYEPTISDAFKITHLPKITDTIKTVPKITYLLHTKPMKVKYDVEPIKPAKMVGEPLTKLYNSYVKVGMGTKVIPQIELFINNKRSKEFLVGAYYKFENSLAKVKLINEERVFAGYSDNDLRFFGKKFLKNSVIQGDMGLLNNARYFYGYNTECDTTLLKEDIKQNYLTIDLNANYKSIYVDSMHINYDIKFSLAHTKDSYKNSETGLKLIGDINKIFSTQKVGVTLGFENYSKSAGLDSTNNLLIRINPWLGIFGNKWRVKAGINTFSDIRGDYSKTLFYPTGSVEYDIANSYLIPYFGIDGKLEINNYRRISTINPFITPGTGLLNTDHKIILYGGFRGNFSSTTYYNIRVKYSLIDDMPFFVNDYTGEDTIGNTFNVVYDNVTILQYFGELAVTPSEELMFNVKLNYSNYTMKDEANPWHKPKFDMTFTTKYNMRNKIILRADILAIGKRYIKLDGVGTIGELESAVDLNFGAEYRYSKVLSAFIQFNNILSDGYSEWNYYPSYGFNIFAGVTYSF